MKIYFIYLVSVYLVVAFVSPQKITADEIKSQQPSPLHHHKQQRNLRISRNSNLQNNNNNNNNNNISNTKINNSNINGNDKIIEKDYDKTNNVTPDDKPVTKRNENQALTTKIERNTSRSRTDNNHFKIVSESPSTLISQQQTPSPLSSLSVSTVKAKDSSLTSATSFNQNNGQLKSKTNISSSKEITAEVLSNIQPTTSRPRHVPGATAQERDIPLMALLAARRNALPKREYGASHRRLLSSRNTTARSSTETISTKSPTNNSRSICERNCTKNFTRRTTASCMQRCVSLQRLANPSFASVRTRVDEKDNNEILLTDESSHGFFVVTKELNDTANHIPDGVKNTISSTEKSYFKKSAKVKQIRVPSLSIEESDLHQYTSFGQKVSQPINELLKITKVDNDYPKILEVSVNPPPRPTERSRGFIRYHAANNRRNLVAYNRRYISTSTTTEMPITSPLNTPTIKSRQENNRTVKSTRDKEMKQSSEIILTTSTAPINKPYNETIKQKIRSTGDAVIKEFAKRSENVSGNDKNENENPFVSFNNATLNITKSANSAELINSYLTENINNSNRPDIHNINTTKKAPATTNASIDALDLLSLPSQSASKLYGPSNIVKITTPLLISVPEEEDIQQQTEQSEHTVEQSDYSSNQNSDSVQTHQPTSTKSSTLSPNTTVMIQPKLDHLPEEERNIIIFIPQSSTSSNPISQTTQPSLIYTSINSSQDSSTKSSTVTSTTPEIITKTTVSTSIRSTVNPPRNDKTDHFNDKTHHKIPNMELINATQFISGQPSIIVVAAMPSNNTEINEVQIDEAADRMYMATYVLAGLGMLPVIVIILYAVRSIYLKTRNKIETDLDGYVTDQQPISPVRKMDKDDPNDDSSFLTYNEFERKNIRFKSLLGEGNFGQVWKAEADDLNGHLGTTRIVAVKTVRIGGSQVSLKEEANIMKKLASHQNVVTLLGACVDSEPHFLIMEYAMRGRLLSLLRAARSATNILPASVPGGRSLAPLSPRTLAGFCLDISRGMEYISEKNIIHRDLAARNILLDHNGVCKICDFGMSVDLDAQQYKRQSRKSAIIVDKTADPFLKHTNDIQHKFKFDIGNRFINQWNHNNNNNCDKKNHDTISKRPALPIRWMAPESLQYHVYSPETDVWAFGIVLWEIATLGSTPYPNLSGREVIRSVPNGARPDLPKEGRIEFYDLMQRCWVKIPQDRPTFREIRNEISRSVCKWVDDDTANSDYMDVSGFSEDLESGMLYFNRRISEFECEI